MPRQRDVAAERAVLAGICRYGGSMFLETTDFVKGQTFDVDSNKMIYKCLEHICKQDQNAVIDLPSILSAAKELGISDFFERKEEAQHLSSILSLFVEEQNVRKFAKKIRLLQIARLIEDQAIVLQNRMGDVNGTETVTELLGIASDTVLNFTSMFDNDSELKAKKVGDGIEEYVEYLEENQCESIGTPTGFPEFDEVMGGGLNPGVTVIGARAKEGKTTLSINIAHNIAKTGIPVLYLDTEMIEKGRFRDISDKLLACVSNQDIKDVKTGKFAQNANAKEAVKSAAQHISNIPLYRIDISGKPFEDQLYAMRRWVQSEVGLNPDGTAKECVIIYDYLKIMDSSGISDAMREFQMLGMMMTALQNFGLRHALPIIALTQLNRDGIDGEHAGVVSGSDRITWFCIAFAILKGRSAEEIAEDPPGQDLGNKKIVVLLSRYGPGHDFGEYVHLRMNKYKAQIEEVDLANIRDVGDQFLVEEDINEDQIPFD